MIIYSSRLSLSSPHTLTRRLSYMCKKVPPSLLSALPSTRPRIPVSINRLPHKYLTTTPTNLRNLSTRSLSSPPSPSPLLLQVQNPRTKPLSRSTIIPSSTSKQSPTITSLFKYLFGSFGPSAEAMSNAKAKAETIVQENAVVVFSKSYCPFCKATKELLQENGASFFQMELDQVEDGPAIQDALEDITGQRTVPNIFINRKHIGGNSELQSGKSELPALLKEAGAI